MKRLSTILMVLMVAGCAHFKPYDDNQHGSLVRMENMTTALLRACSDPYAASRGVSAIRDEEEFLHTYTDHRTSKRAQELVSKIHVILDGMELRYEVSMPTEEYCFDTTTDILDLVHEALETL